MDLEEEEENVCSMLLIAIIELFGVCLLKQEEK